MFSTHQWTAPAVGEVTLRDRIFSHLERNNISVTIPTSLQKCHDTGRIDAFKLEWKPGMPNEPHIFWDSDVAKVIEGACEALMQGAGKDLADEVDRLVDLIISAQQPDGYLNTYFTVVKPEKRWSCLFLNHELYCAGHLMEAAVAHFRATGSRKFLDCMCRYADYIGSVFGWEEGKKRGVPGHEEIELALCKLADATGEKRYLDLAKYFIDARGITPNYFLENEEPCNLLLTASPKYCQAHIPLREQKDADGHAVRALYVYSGMADVAARTGDEELLNACRNLWESVAKRRMYVTGGCGSRWHGESFGNDYELPHDSYAESCASMAFALFSWRMMNITGESRYADELERVLYNGAISGIALSGEKFFYANKMEAFNHNGDRMEYQTIQRVPWFSCSCCPTSYCRFLPQLGTFLWSKADGCLRLNIPAASEISYRGCRVAVASGYPFDGDVAVTFTGEGSFDFAMRIPAWCSKWTILLNGAETQFTMDKGYAVISRSWQDGDRIELRLEMQPRVIFANAAAVDCSQRAALQCGPVIYCVESSDFQVPILSLRLPVDQKFTLGPAPDGLPDYLRTINGTAVSIQISNPDNELYFTSSPVRRQVRFTAVPYVYWNNRGPSDMRIWLPFE
ncbi:MAG: glycoside hydrolase family 127 protein [Victivallales bacterium]|nr:glycoside hydrolase family 127 protein [Victivallales bacterium]